MSVIIYCIEDINELIYIGYTTKSLNIILNKHKRKRKPCSSSILDLNNCSIYKLEECNKKYARSRKYYWIYESYNNKLKCVNIKSMIIKNNILI